MIFQIGQQVRVVGNAYDISVSCAIDFDYIENILFNKKSKIKVLEILLSNRIRLSINGEEGVWIYDRYLRPGSEQLLLFEL